MKASGSPCCHSSTPAATRPEGARRRIDGRNHHRPVALLLPARDRARFDREVCQRVRRRPGHRQGTRRALCDGRQPAPGWNQVASRSATRGRNLRLASVGGNLRARFNPEAVFELQDELVPRIVSTVADTHGVLPHTCRRRHSQQESRAAHPYEAVLARFQLRRANFSRRTCDSAGRPRAGR